jgi:hypothetical protein
VRPEGLGKIKISPHRVSNPRPSTRLPCAPGSSIVALRNYLTELLFNGKYPRRLAASNYSCGGVFITGNWALVCHRLKGKARLGL